MTDKEWLQRIVHKQAEQLEKLESDNTKLRQILRTAAIVYGHESWPYEPPPDEPPAPPVKAEPEFAFWACKIGPVPRPELPGGMDRPFREVVERAFVATFGRPATIVDTGWENATPEEEPFVPFPPEKHTFSHPQNTEESDYVLSQLGLKTSVSEMTETEVEQMIKSKGMKLTAKMVSYSSVVGQCVMIQDELSGAVVAHLSVRVPSPAFDYKETAVDVAERVVAAFNGGNGK